MSKNNYKPEAHAILLILQKIPCIVSWRWFKLTGWVLLQYLHPESRYDGEDMSLISIYNKNKKRRGKSKYLLSVMVDVVKDGDIISYLIAYSFFISSRLNSVEGRLVITHSYVSSDIGNLNTLNSILRFIIRIFV